MLRKTRLFFMVAMVTMLLFSCIFSGSAQKTISIMHIWSGAREPLLEEVIARFEAANPDIKVESILVSGPGPLEEKAMLAFVSGTGPDIIMAYPNQAQAWAAEGALVPMNEFIEADNVVLSDYFYESVLPSTQYEGDVIFLPHLGGAIEYLLYWNVNEVAAAGLHPEQDLLSDLEQLRRSAAKLSKYDADGTLSQVGLDIGCTPGLFETYLLLHGGHGLGQWQGDKYVYTFADELGQKTLHWMRETFDSVAGGEKNMGRFYSLKATGGEGAFLNGLAAMHFGGEWFFTMLWDDGWKSFTDFNVGLRPPAPGVSVPQYCAGTGWGYVISGTTQYPEEAWRFLRYFTMEEGAAYFLVPQGRPSVLREVNRSPEYFEVNPFWPVIMSAFEYAVNVETPRNQVDSQPLKDAILRVLAGEEDEKTALEEAARLMQVHAN